MTEGYPRGSPVLLTPHLDPKPWGGRRLEDLGIALPPDVAVGEAHLTAPEAVIASGQFRGWTLRQLVEADPSAWVGKRGMQATGGRPLFPLLIKLITSETHLSIQVHPDDRFAAAEGLGTGKTEAYHILAADPGSVLFLGLMAGVEIGVFQEACRCGDGSAAAYLRRVPVEPGMTFLIPAGTIHAPGAGIVLYEIQQPSNVTFRLDDWGRLDHNGQRRALHHAEGFRAFDPEARPVQIDPLVPPAWPAGRELLVATPYFALERIEPQGKGTVEIDLPAVETPQVLTCLEGPAAISTAAGDLTLERGETAVVPVGNRSGLRIPPLGVVLRGWVPDLHQEVVGPARSVGVGTGALRSLGVELASRESREAERSRDGKALTESSSQYPYPRIVRCS